MLNLCIILLDPVQQSLPRLREWQIHLVRLQLEVVLALEQGGSLFFKVLCTLLEGVLLEAGFGLDEARVDFLEVSSTPVNLLSQPLILLLQPLILVPLLRVQVIQLALIGHVDVLYLLLDIRDLVLHVALLREDLVQVLPLLVVLVLDMHEQGFDVLWLGIGPVLIQSQVIISQLPLILPHVLNQRLVLPLQGHIGLIILVDLFDLGLHLVDLIHDLRVLLLKQVVVVVSIIDLSARSGIIGLEALDADTMIGNGSLDDVDLGVLSDTREIRLSIGSSTQSHGSCHSCRIIVGCTAHLHALGCWNTSVHI